MGGLFDLGAAVVAAPMAGEDVGAIDDTQLERIGEHGQLAADVAKRDRIIVQVEADVRCLADRYHDMFEHRRRVGREREQARPFLVEHRAHGAFGLIRTAPIGGVARAPSLGLSVEVIDIGEAARGEERVTDEPDGSLHATFFVPPGHRHRAWLVSILGGEAEQGGMKADRVAASLEHDARRIVVEQDTRHATPGGERRNVTAQKVLHPGVEIEVQEDLAREAQHHDERHQRTARPADLEVAEMRPIDLCLFARQAPQTQIGLGLAARPMASDEMTKVIRPALVAAFTDHRVEPAGGQCRKCRQRLVDERQIRVDQRLSWRRPEFGQPGLGQDAPHDAVMDVQLPRDGADGPFFGVVEAQDLRLDVRRCHHSRVPSNPVAQRPRDEPGDAQTPAGPAPDIAVRTSDSARPAATADPPRLLRRSRSPAS